MYRFLLLFSSFLVLVNCASDHCNEELRIMDSLIREENFEKAMMLVERVDTTKLDTEELAVFRVMRSQTRYKLYLDDPSLCTLDSCISYFKKTGNEERLAQALCFRGMTSFLKGNIEFGFSCLKRAERLAKGKHLRRDVLFYLAYCHDVSKNFTIAIDYYHKGAHLAQEEHNDRWVGTAWMNISSAYADMNKKDSADYYKKKCIGYVDSQPVEDRTTYLNNIAAYFEEKGMTTDALALLEQSIALEPTPQAHFYQARIYSRLGQETMADSLWSRTLNEASGLLRIPVLKEYAQWMEKLGRYEEARIADRQRDALQDSVNGLRQQELVALIHNQNDKYFAEERQKGLESRNKMISCILSFTIAMLVILCLFYRWKKRKIKEGQTRQKAIIEHLTKENENYEVSISKLDKETEHIRQKAKATKMENARLIRLMAKKDNELSSIKESQGKILLKTALGKEDCGSWSKNEIELVLNYCATEDQNMMDSIRVKYPQATNREMVVQILRYYEVDDERIMTLLGMSKGAWSTFLTRMRQKDAKKQDNGQ